ncbi:trypsin domain-containing protein [Ditylenchus destructor]|nr:trypsin domain-containing protein [Ditylenchus destructor]
MKTFSLFFVAIVFVVRSIYADEPELECGISKHPPYPSHHRIINGTLARKGQLPWVAYTNTFTLCTATIISPNYVMTAGHCVVESGVVAETAKVRVGTVDQFDMEVPTVVSEVHGVIPHPKYNGTPPCDQSPAHDIAIIKLSKSLNFSEYVRPICLKKTFEETESDVAIISGYGAKIWFHLPCSPGCPIDAYDGKLRWGTSKFVDEQQCRQALSKVEKACLSDSPIVCGRGIHQVETFLGDSGGPLAVVNSNRTDGKKQYMQVGVTSSTDGDNFQGNPSVYTRVSLHCDWIAEVTGGEVNCRD